MLVCRVIRFILARLIIDLNRWLLISYKQLLHLAHVFTSNLMKLKDSEVKLEVDAHGYVDERKLYNG